MSTSRSSFQNIFSASPSSNVSKLFSHPSVGIALPTRGPVAQFSQISNFVPSSSSPLDFFTSSFVSFPEMTLELHVFYPLIPVHVRCTALS